MQCSYRDINLDRLAERATLIASVRPSPLLFACHYALPDVAAAAGFVSVSDDADAEALAALHSHRSSFSDGDDVPGSSVGGSCVVSVVVAGANPSVVVSSGDFSGS